MPPRGAVRFGHPHAALPGVERHSPFSPHDDIHAVGGRVAVAHVAIAGSLPRPFTEMAPAVSRSCARHSLRKAPCRPGHLLRRGEWRENVPTESVCQLRECANCTNVQGSTGRATYASLVFFPHEQNTLPSRSKSSSGFHTTTTTTFSTKSNTSEHVEPKSSVCTRPVAGCQAPNYGLLFLWARHHGFTRASGRILRPGCALFRCLSRQVPRRKPL